VARQIVMDTETTGLEADAGHNIIEIGCVEMVARKLTGNTYHQYINPDHEIDAEAMEVHGITHEFLADKPKFKEVMHAFVEFVRGAELIIHNAAFDVGFLDHELSLMKHARPKISDHCQVLDTLSLARKIHPGQRNSLDALCKRYAIDASKRDVHGALIDSELLARVYLAMTGGQSSLLLDEESDKSARGRPTRRGTGRSRGQRPADGANYTLTVVQATAEEAAAHEAMLEKIRESGACVWDFD